MSIRRMRVLGLVPARGGSKGIPHKNLRLLAGKPLLAYTAKAALGAKRLDRVLLSTDDPEIVELGQQCGLWSPFLRPANLARDDTPMFPVVLHALDWLQDQGEQYDAVCLLQPTSPLRRSSDIDGCIDLCEQSGADCVLSVLPVPDRHNPHWVYFLDEGGFMQLALGDGEPVPRRQELPQAYHREGSVYVCRVEVMRRRGSLYGHQILPYMLTPAQSINLDEEADWQRAERLLGNNR